MKKTIILTFAVFLAGLFLASCDKIEEDHYLKEIPNNSDQPKPSNTGQNTLDTTGQNSPDTTVQKNLYRKVLIIDFTGHKCGNCPKGHRMITSLEGTYHDAVVPVAIHCTSTYASPDPGTAYATDFRTVEGEYLCTYMDLEGLPSGLINTMLPASISSAPTEWATQFARYVNVEPELSIEVEPSIANGTATANVKVTAETACSRKLSLVVYVVEDGIVGGQKDYESNPPDIENYVHNHVLRMSFNGALGENIKDNTDAMTQDAMIEKSYSKAFNSDWNIANCKVVAFVYDSDTKEVLQAEMVNISE